MGKIFLEHIGGQQLYCCAACDANLTNRDELISTRFTGATGRAFLFNKVVNLIYRSEKNFELVLKSMLMNTYINNFVINFIYSFTLDEKILGLNTIELLLINVN